MFNKIIATLLLLFTLTAQAQTKPIKVVVPFGVGGLVDNLNRRFAEALEEELKRPVQVDMRPGAAGYIGLKHIAGTKNDEVLISLIDAMAVSNAILLHNDLSLDDFKFVAQLGITTSIGLAVKKGSSFNTVASIRAHRGRDINIGINGIGGAHHYYNWLLASQLPNTPIKEIPYKGVNEMLQDLLGGHIDAIWSNLSSLEQQVALGNVEVVGIIQQQRVGTSPEIPTFSEQNVTMPQNAKWILLSNQTTDLATVQQIDRAIRRLIVDPRFAQIIRNIGLVLEPKLVDQATNSMLLSIKQQTKFVEFINTQRKQK